jgi:hypothetical protein
MKPILPRQVYRLHGSGHLNPAGCLRVPISPNDARERAQTVAYRRLLVQYLANQAGTRQRP